ncbi:TlpA disulfide reductase family protein [Oleiagrimonas citrea]
MDKGIAIGPFLFQTPLLVLLLAVAVAMMAAGALQKRGTASVQTPLWIALLAALLVARVAFVVRRWPDYAAHPLSMLNVRDGGFMAWPGVIALLVALLVLLWRRPRLRMPLTVAGSFGLGTWLVATLVVAQLSAAMQRPLPDLTLHDLKGAPVSLRALTGKPMVINLWATWCPPCRREMPMLIDAQARDTGVRFVFVDQAESAETVRTYLRGLPRAPRHVLIDDSQQLARQFNLRGTPTTLFVDADGTVRDIHVGELSAATLAEGLSHLASPAPVSGDAP